MSGGLHSKNGDPAGVTENNRKILGGKSYLKVKSKRELGILQA